MFLEPLHKELCAISGPFVAELGATSGITWSHFRRNLDLFLVGITSSGPWSQ